MTIPSARVLGFVGAAGAAVVLAWCYGTVTTSHDAAPLARVALFGGLGLLMFALWLSWPKLRTRALACALLLGLALALRLAMFGAAPSDDLARYQWEGRLVANGQSPYLGPASAEVYSPWHDTLYQRMNHQDKLTAYPPLAQLGFGALATVGLSDAWFKSAMVAADLTVVALLLWLLSKRGLPLRWGVFYACNPVVLVAFAAEGHFDVWMILALVSTTALMDARRAAWAGVCLAAAVQFKLIALLGLPFLIKRAGWRVLPPFVLAATAPALPFWANLDTLMEGVWAFGTERAFNGAVHQLALAASGSREVANVIVTTGLAIVFTGRWCSLRAQRDWASDWIWICGGLLVFSPTFHFWYLAWLLPMIALRPSLAWLAFSVAQAGYFLVWRNAGEGAWGLTPLESGLMWAPLLLLGLYELRHAPRGLGSLIQGSLTNFPQRWPLWRMTLDRPPQPTISVIIPTLNAAQHLPNCLRSVSAADAGFEVIIADGGSTDATAEIVRRAGVKWVKSAPGRGAQIAAGVAQATGSVILILHADAQLPPEAAQRIGAALRQPSRPLGGCLGQRFNQRRLGLLGVEMLNEARASLGGTAFGDQAIFYDRQRFSDKDLPIQPLMEDVELSLRLVERGCFVYLGVESTVSASKWHQGRSWRRFRQVIALNLRYHWARLWSHRRAQQLSQQLYTEYYGPTSEGKPPHRQK